VWYYNPLSSIKVSSCGFRVSSPCWGAALARAPAQTFSQEES
jgi:hypothetical protein